MFVHNDFPSALTSHELVKRDFMTDWEFFCQLSPRNHGMLANAVSMLTSPPFVYHEHIAHKK